MGTSSRAVLLTAFAIGCGRGSEGGTLSPEEMAKLKAEVKAEVKAELADEWKAELKGQLLAGLRDDLRASPPPPEPLMPASDEGDEPASEPVEAPPKLPPPATAGQPVVEAPPEPVAPPVDPPIRADGETRPARQPPEAPEAAAPDAPVVRGRLDVMTFVVAKGIDRETRTPTDPGTQFDIADTPVVFGYLVAKNEGDDTTGTIEWLQGGEVRCRLELKIGRSTRGWRTWSSCRLNPKWVGSWIARVLDSDGKVVARAGFTVR